MDNTFDFSKGGRGLGAVYLSSLFKELAFMLVYTRCSSKYISEVMIKGICTTLHMCNENCLEREENIDINNYCSTNQQILNKS